MKNKYCQIASLRNEADVEQNFVRRLLEDFGYADEEILPKNSLDELTVGGLRGQPQQQYRPDFGLRLKRKVRWIVEAKSPGESLGRHGWQPRAYCVLLNGSEKDEKPVRYYLLTNGQKTVLSDPTLNDPILELAFVDFVDGNEKFRELHVLTARDRILLGQAGSSTKTLTLEKKSLADVNAAFLWCHQHIYRKGDTSQSDAFTEFVKIIALKLMSDRRIRDKHPEIIQDTAIEVPVDEVDFSLRWVEQNERYSRNPINDIQFRTFMEDMEREIATGKRKRIFEATDQITLNPETIRGVVRRLEGIFLFGVDADLNGRLFETFLNATMRGKDLGQFFTPRSLVKLGVQLARIKVEIPNGHGGRRSDTVVDACCGSGGFLIDALADMWAKVERKKNLSTTEKAAIKKEIADNNIIGVDVANGPKLARIARLNMYLHGDGGTRIFHLNALDKKLPNSDSDSPDIRKEKEELRKLICGSGFDIALTNPPFAKAYDRGTDEGARILDDYKIGRDNGVAKSSVRSCLLFAERYHDLLRPGGTWITIIDDGILSGEEYKRFRAQLRVWFIIRAVISLPGDAFQRSNARVKTSYLIGEKRDPDQHQEQSPIFMYPCQYVGIDDPKRQRARPGDAAAHVRADEEIQEVVAEYEKFLNGDSQNYTVQPSRISDRLDVKNCLMSRGRKVGAWRKSGFRVLRIDEVLEERTYTDEKIVTKDYPDLVRVAVVRYDGRAEAGDDISPSEGSYAKLYPVKAGDILISNIAASYGSMAVVPDDLEDSVVSSEYTVLKVKHGFDPIVVQLILRSPEIRADILLSSSGANRTRAKWELIKEIEIPYPDRAVVTRIQELSQEAEEATRRASLASDKARGKIESTLLLQSQAADTILAAFKPPQ